MDIPLLFASSEKFLGFEVATCQIIRLEEGRYFHFELISVIWIFVSYLTAVPEALLHSKTLPKSLIVGYVVGKFYFRH